MKVDAAGYEIRRKKATWAVMTSTSVAVLTFKGQEHGVRVRSVVWIDTDVVEFTLSTSKLGAIHALSDLFFSRESAVFQFTYRGHAAYCDAYVTVMQGLTYQLKLTP